MYQCTKNENALILVQLIFEFRHELVKVPKYRIFTITTCALLHNFDEEYGRKNKMQY